MKLELTAGGIDYLSHCLEGGPSPEFCKITFGNGANAGGDADEISNPIKDIPIAEITRDGDFVTLIGVLNNATVLERFRATEIGVYITDPDDTVGSGTILFAYAYAPEEEAAVIPAAADYTFETVEKVLVYVGKTEDVTAIISDSLLTATKAELQAHTDDNNNPHNVTAAQVGLGNVPNVSTDDQTPTISEYSAERIPEVYDKIETDMPLSEILSKLAALATAFRWHENDSNNPHSLTPFSIGAADDDHKHSANDITSGLLSVQRGGTGVSSMNALANALSSYFNIPYFGVYSGNGNTKRLISLGFTPSAVIIADSRGLMGDDVAGTCGGIAVGASGVRSYSSSSLTDATTWSNTYTAIQITTNGFYVNYSSSKVATNKSGETYRYIAFR